MDEQLMNFLEALFSGQEFRSDPVGNDTVNDYIIDTCHTLDCGYETGVCKGSGAWIIVQRYPDRESAEKGHKIWQAICAANPAGAISVQTNRYEEF